VLTSPENLIAKIKAYAWNIEEDLVKKAYIFALDKHGLQVRDSGKPYFTHPIEVTEILIDIKMDQETLIAGLLHDTVEDTDTTIEDIKKLFGNSVANIVDGVTKLNKFESYSISERQTENFKKLLISASYDIRILIIKLADRLHNMRTLKFRKKQDKREYTAKETLNIYAPLAERIGLIEIKDELQNIAFMVLNPDIYKSITSRLEHVYESSNEIIKQIISIIENLAKQIDLPCSVIGRVKKPYSIWEKMNIRNISFEQLSDIMAFRIIVDQVSQCYQILGEIHKNYAVIPGRFRDYISTPKNNKYQSLHTSVIGPFNKRIEIQIRTKEMHAIAEFGIAAHWNYKEKGKSVTADVKKQQWLESLSQLLNTAFDVGNILESSKTNLQPEMIYCITPKGELLSFPKGSTVLDFAYAIHSHIGDHAIKGKINGKTTELKTILENGDQVEILTDPSVCPSASWLDHVITTKSKARIRKALDNLENEKIEMIGRSNFEEFIKQHDLKISESDIKRILKTLKISNANFLFKEIGRGAIHMQDIFPQCSIEDYYINNDGNDENNSSIFGISNLFVLPKSCCFPVPGDKITGVIFPDKNIEIHISECHILKTMETQSKIKNVELAWTKTAFDKKKYTTKIVLKILYESGNLAKISQVVESKGSSISDIRIEEKLNNFVNIQIRFEVSDLTQLTVIIASLKSLDFIQSINR
jgi:GTP pyrophosphokinase